MSGTIEYDLTGNYGLKKPWLDADDDVWGQHINENMDLIDSLLVTRGFDASKYLLLTGGEITGDLSVLGALTTGGPVMTTGTGPALIGSSTGAGIVLSDSTSNRLAGTLNVDGLTVGALLTVAATGVAIAAPQFTVDAPSLIELNGAVGSVFLGPDTNTLGGDWHVGGMLTLATDPVNPLDAATRRYVDATVGSYLPLAGGEISGDVQIDGKLRVGATVDAGFKFDLAGTARINLPVAAIGVSPFLVTNGQTTFPAAAIHPGALSLITANSASTGPVLQVMSFGSFGPTFVGTLARGTAAAPTAVSTGDTLFGFWGHGFDGTNWGYATNMYLRAAEPWTPTAHGTMVLFGGTSLGTTANNEWLRMMNGNVLIGTTVDSGYRLDVRGAGRFDTYTGTGSLPSGAALWVAAPDANSVNINVAAYGTNAVPRLAGYSANGTRLAPTATQLNNVLLAINSNGYGATGFSINPRAGINFTALENWTDAAQGAGIMFRTTPNTTIATAEVGRFAGSGNLLLGTTTDAGFKLDVIGTGRFSGLLSANGGVNIDGGPLTVGTNATARVIAVNGPAASTRTLQYQTAGVLRWQIFANLSAEAGSNAGSDLDLVSYSDAGTALINPAIRVIRSTGNILIGSGTDAGFKLDVVGTARFSSTITGTTQPIGTESTAMASTQWVARMAGGFTSITLSDADTTLTAAQVGVRVINLGGTLTADRTITMPAATFQRDWVIRNGTGGGFNVIVSFGSGNTFSIPTGLSMEIFWSTAAEFAAHSVVGPNFRVGDATRAGLILNSGVSTSSPANITVTGTGGLQFITMPLGFNSASPINKPTVTGAKAGNTALASLCAALVSYGLIADTSSA